MSLSGPRARGGRRCWQSGGNNGKRKGKVSTKSPRCGSSHYSTESMISPTHNADLMAMNLGCETCRQKDKQSQFQPCAQTRSFRKLDICSDDSPNPVTTVSPHSRFHSANRLPSTVRAITSRMSQLFLRFVPVTPPSSFGS